MTTPKRIVLVACAVALLHLLALFTLGKYNRVYVHPTSGQEIPANAFVTFSCNALQFPLVTTDVVFSNSRTRFVAVVTANSLLWGFAVSLIFWGFKSVRRKNNT